DFFFQAEDGIRDFHVTGVQTCALPISRGAGGVVQRDGSVCRPPAVQIPLGAINDGFQPISDLSKRHVTSPLCFSSICTNLPKVRSEERRVGKECGYRCI